MSAGQHDEIARHIREATRLIADGDDASRTARFASGVNTGHFLAEADRCYLAGSAHAHLALLLSQQANNRPVTIASFA